MPKDKNIIIKLPKDYNDIISNTDQALIIASPGGTVKIIANDGIEWLLENGAKIKIKDMDAGL